MIGSAGHADGPIACFKALGAHFGDDEASAAALVKTLKSKTTALDRLDEVTDTASFEYTTVLA